MNVGQTTALIPVFTIEPHHIPAVDYSKPGWDMPMRVGDVLARLARSEPMGQILAIYGHTTVDAALERIGHPPTVKIPFCPLLTR